MKKRWIILILALFLGFGVFLKSRWTELARIDAANRALEVRITEKWRESVALREAATSATAARIERFQLRQLAAVFIDARVTGRGHDPEGLRCQSEKLSRLSVDELEVVIDELQASSFPDDARIGIETMLSTALVARCCDEPGHDSLIHRFLMNSPGPLGPEITRPLVALIADSKLRSEVIQQLGNLTPR